MLTSSRVCLLVPMLLVAGALTACSGGGHAVPPNASSPARAQFAVPPRLNLAVPRRPDFIGTVPPKPQSLSSGTRSPRATTHPSFFAGEVALSNGVYYLQLPNSNIFGYYSYLPDPRYIYHFDLGYEYLIDANDGVGGLYMYDFASNHWWYTGRQYPFPDIYDFGLSAFLYYFPDSNNAGHYTTNPRYFYNFTAGAIIAMPDPANCATLPAQQSGSTYTLTSNPSGLTVRRVDASNPVCVYFSGVTQASDIPQTAPHPWQYVFAPASANPYTVTVAQELNGNHTIFYNQAGDSSGSVVLSSLQSVGRRTGSSTLRGSETARGIRRFSGAGVVPDQVLVRYRGGAAQMRARATQIELAEGTTARAELTTVSGAFERFVGVPAGTDAAAFSAKLRAQRDVADVFPVHKRFALSRSAQTVNDPHANNTDQWYLFADGFPNAWSYSQGTGATIAVIDTGIDLNNTDITARLRWSTGYANAGHTAQDTNGHGTNVAGIAAASANNALGFAGGGYNVDLLAYNIFPDSTSFSDAVSASVADEVSALNDAVSRGVDVISLSIGAAQDYGANNGFDQGEHDAIEAAIAAGVTVVAAAGNDADGGETGTPHTVLDYPAGYDGVIAVGATGLHDNNTGLFAGSTEYVTSYSQYGPGLGLVAPGGDPTGPGDNSPLHWIWNYSTTTAGFKSDQCTYRQGTLPAVPTNCTAFFAGTSQATPQVSAAAALLISQAGHRVLTPARVAQLLESTADNINDPHQGHGRLNAYKALAALTGDTGAYSGPTTQKTSPTQLVAFGYDNISGTVPHVLDLNYTAGVPVNPDGTFRLGDIWAGVASYHVGVWYDANGNGVVDAGDQFGTPGVTCNPSQRCTIGTVTLHTVTAGFTLP